MRYLRERPAVRQQHLTRAQRLAAPLERESAGGEGAGQRRAQEASGVRQLHQERQDCQGIEGRRVFGPLLSDSGRIPD